MAEGSCRKSKAVEETEGGLRKVFQELLKEAVKEVEELTTVHNSSLFYTRKPEGNSGVKKPDAS